MKLPGLQEWLFSIRTFAAAMLALYIGFAFDLDRPYWAMASAYIASQPFSGATRSKAVYRAMGTVLGAVAAVALVPNLVDAPALLSLALAAWIGICLYFALLDRTPRSYVFMLAGYTAAIIGFPSVATPGDIFLTAVARVEEIGLGIACASLMASVVFPRRVQPVLLARLDAWLGNTARWGRSALAGEKEDEAVRAERRRLAGDLAEIDLLTSYLGWDPAAAPDAVRTLRALRARMLMLLPVLSSLADRVRAVRDTGMPAPLQSLLETAAQWVRGTDPHPPPALRDAIAQTQAQTGPHDWSALLQISLLQRLRELLDLLEDCRRLEDHIRQGGPFPIALAFHRTAGPAEVRHRDHGRALWSGFSAALAVGLVCLFWIGAAWADGAVAAELAAVACCFFAALDDPVPAIVQFLTWSVVAVLVDAALLFAILPAADGFPMLALALAPPFLLFGTLTAMPQTAAIGMALTANGATLLSLQSTYNAQFDSFVNSGIALVVGMGAAAIVTRIVRSVGAEWSAWRLMRQGWIDLAVAAERRGQGDRAVFAGLMLDRISLIAPRIVAAGPGSNLAAADLLADLRVGLNIVALRRTRRRVPAAAREEIDAMLDALAVHFRARARRAKPDGTALLACIDRALAAITPGPGAQGAMQGAMLALVGIRRALFPAAAPYPAPTSPAELQAAA